jgi:hypothetical protein
MTVWAVEIDFLFHVWRKKNIREYRRRHSALPVDAQLGAASFRDFVIERLSSPHPRTKPPIAARPKHK